MSKGSDQAVELLLAHRYGADLVANAAVLFRHGASPDPWLCTVLSQLQIWARGDASISSDELQYCLPRSLHAANDELNARYDALLKRAGLSTMLIRTLQRKWIRERDRACKVEELAGMTQAGWLAYVLSEPAWAQCVPQLTRNRAAALGAMQ